MAVQTLLLGNRKFVVVPETEFRRLQARVEQITAEEKGDVAESKRRAGERDIPLSAIAKRLGR